MKRWGGLSVALQADANVGVVLTREQMWIWAEMNPKELGFRFKQPCLNKTQRRQQGHHTLLGVKQNKTAFFFTLSTGPSTFLDSSDII